VILAATGGCGSGANASPRGGAPTMGVASGQDSGSQANSTACTKAAPSADCNTRVAPGDMKDCMLGQREYLIYAPKNLDPCNPVPLVIDGHGASETAPQQLEGMPPFCAGAGTCWQGPGSGWRLESEEPEGGFVLVTPQGIGNRWSQGTDPDFMMQLVTQIETVANIDPKKVYITGISNGAALSYWTACAHPDVFAGLSPNSGGTLGASVCGMLSKPIIDIQFDDKPDFAFSDSQSSVTALAAADNCKEGPKDWKTIDSTTTDKVCLLNPDDNATKLVACDTIMPPVQPTTCRIWDQCDGNVQVVFCQVAAGTLHGASNAALDGHIIYENSTNLNTPSVAWRFFRSFW
jgi:poly(3-hydroxybutyrate) depolymerase